MDDFLANYYGTGTGAAETTNDEIEKLAQLTLLAQEAEEQGIDLGQFTEEEIMKVASERYGGGEAQPEYDLEKEAAAKFEEADFLGRVMAHSMVQELGEIEKQANWAGDLARKGWAATKAAPGKAYGSTLGAVGGKAEEAVAKSLREGGKGKTFKSLIHRLGGGKGLKSGDTYRKGSERLARGANIAAQVGTGAAAAGAAGGLGYGGYRGVKALRDKKSADSAFEQVVMQRAYDHLASGGYDADAFFGVGQEKTAADEFEATVDRAALEFLEANGVPIAWNE